MTTLLTWLSAILILSGSVLALTAAIGIVRFPDSLMRMHAASKPQVVGLVLVLSGTAIEIRDNRDMWMIILVIPFTMLTAPVIGHLLGRTAYRENTNRGELRPVDRSGE
ncbi:monovalent cation/H(+) antiporter subunit G [Nocardia sp. NPDC003693]